MKNPVFGLIIFLFFFSCSKDEGSIETLNQELNEVGNLLAEWAGTNCKIISINSKQILWEGPNAGGCSPIYFEYTGFSDNPFFEEKEADVKRILKSLYENSNCEKSLLFERVQSIDSQTSEHEIAEILGCLGVVEFLQGEVGIE